MLYYEKGERRDLLINEDNTAMLTVYNQSILSDLAKIREKEEFYYSITPSLEAINVFDFVSSHTNVEWAIGSFNSSGEKIIALIRGSADSVNRLSQIEGVSEESIIASILTHIGDIQDHGASGYVAPTTVINDRTNLITMYESLSAKGYSLLDHFVYEVPTSQIYKYTLRRGDIPYAKYSKKNLVKALKLWNSRIKAF